MVRLVQKKKGNNIIDLEGYDYVCHFCKQKHERLYFCSAEKLLICWNCVGYEGAVHSRYSPKHKLAHFATEHSDIPVHEVQNAA